MPRGQARSFRSLPPRARAALLGGLALFGALLGFTVLEIGLRLNGFTPWEFLETDRDEPVLCEPDPVLGWRNRPGRHALPAFVAGAPPTHVTILGDRTRATGVAAPAAGPALVLSGCSYFYGWGIDDDETCAAALQRRYPASRVVNLGTPAYGTYQSLLRLVEYLAAAPPPDIVLYGFIAEHEERNVASGAWLRVLGLYNRRGHVAAPYATWSARGLVHHPPARYWAPPGRTFSAAITAAAELGMHLTTRARTADRRKVTEALLAEMHRVVAARGSKLVVALLEAKPPTREHYAQFLMAQRIPFVDVAFARTQAYKIAGEEHPNGAMNARWAEGIASAFAAWGWK